MPESAAPRRSSDPTEVEALAEAILARDRRALARGITLVESSRGDDRKHAATLLERLAPHAGRSMRIGISGVPGVGKSTFLDAFGMHAIRSGHRMAVLAVDPSSGVSGGAILGDKTRMPRLATATQAFIRPSPAGGTLGGVARRTREAILVCEAAGHDLIAVETVGVGQSETAVAQMTDAFVLMLLPGGGDELQGIKRGIIELADVLLVNKADGEMADAAGRAAADYANALRLLHPRAGDWEVPVATCSALEERGVEDVYDTVVRFVEHLRATGELERRRATQALDWMWSEASGAIVDALRSDPDVRGRVRELERAVAAGEIPPTSAAASLVEVFLGGSDR